MRRNMHFRNNSCIDSFYPTADVESSNNFNNLSSNTSNDFGRKLINKKVTISKVSEVKRNDITNNDDTNTDDKYYYY